VKPRGGGRSPTEQNMEVAGVEEVNKCVILSRKSRN
jgi:hypothetical protein